MVFPLPFPAPFGHGQRMAATVTSLPCSRAEADTAMLADEPFAGHAGVPTLVAAEEDGQWQLRLYLEGVPDAALLRALGALAPSAAVPPCTERLPDSDWVTLSQAGLEPVDLGRFHVHTGEHGGLARPGQWPIRIDAGLAFGTGQHATTAGCIRTAARLARRQRKTDVLDVGTGSGLLAFAAHRLFPRARITAADLDPVAVGVAAANARINHVRRGMGAGEIALCAAPGVTHPLILSRAPYDLVFANILAGPLVALAPSLAAVVAEGGHLILAGLLAPQRQQVIASYRAQGLLLVERSRGAEWPVLLLQKVRPASRLSARRLARRETAARGWRIDTI